MNVNRAAVTTVAMVSGKGGTGKTTLSVALAQELSKSGQVLLVDLDFFNHGLEGLLAGEGRRGANGTPGAAKDDAADAELGRWARVDVDRNISCVYRDEDAGKGVGAMGNGWEPTGTRSLDDIRRRLEALIASWTVNVGCDFIVMDCHGGPDMLSLAACQVATHAICVAEPDRQSVHGTLNFVGMLRGAGDGPCRGLGFVFNRVDTRFSAQFLVRFYEGRLAKAFENRELLGIFPHEDCVAATAGQRPPVPTKWYPFALMARKVEILVRVLLKDAGVQLRSVPFVDWRIVREKRFARVRTGWLLTEANWLMTIGAGAVMATVVAVVASSGGLEGAGAISLVAFCLIGLTCGLVTVAAIRRATHGATDKFTFLARSGRRLRSIWSLTVVLGIAGAAAFIVGFAMTDVVGALVHGRAPLGVPRALVIAPEWLFWSAYGVLGGSVRGVACLWEEFARCVQTSREREYRWETVGRLVVLGCCGMSAIAGGWVAR